MNDGPLTSGGGSSICNVTVSAFAPDVATIEAVPADTAVASPVALTVATASFRLDQVKVASGIVASTESFATAVNCCVPPSMIVAPSGEMVTLATEPGGMSLQMPKLFAEGPLHTPEPLRFND